MATTTNYGWTTPDDTALVKDGAAAIRTLGSSVDTTTKNLNPSTTLGDIEYRSSTANVNTRLPLGTAGQVLKVNSGATAPEWSSDNAGMTNPMTTTGDTIYSSSGSTPARLGIGTTGQVLTVAAGVPSWATASAGGMTLIAETVASANSSIVFSSIAGTYKQLLLTWNGLYASTTGTWDVRFNNNSGSVYELYKVDMFGAEMSVSDGSYAFAGGGNCFGNNSSSTTPADTGTGYMYIDNYASASKYKTYWSNIKHFNNSNSRRTIQQILGFFESTTAITSVDIVQNSSAGTLTNIANTSIRLYGIS
jgi:hypothetical protein